ncbi:MAG: GAF domain-containing protein [Haloquadratum sp.]
MTRGGSGGRVLVVVSSAQSGSDGGAPTDETPGGGGGGDENGDGPDDGSDDGESFLRGGGSSAGTQGNPADGTAGPDRDPQLDPPSVVSELEAGLETDVVVRSGETATEYLRDLGPTLDCVVVHGIDEELIQDLLDSGEVPIVVYDPPAVGTVEGDIVPESPASDLLDRVEGEIDANRTQSELRESNARLTALSRYAEDITACQTVDAVVQRTVEATTEALAFEFCVVGLVEGGRLVPKATALPDPPIEPIDADRGIAGRTLRTGEPQVVSDLTGDPDAIVHGDGMRSVASVPIDGHGVLQVVSGRVDAFDDRDVEFLEILAGYTREALERIEREVTLRRERDRLHAFFDELPVPALYVERRDGVTTIREANAAFAERFGGVRAGRPLAEVLPTDAEVEQYEAALGTDGVATATVERRVDTGATERFDLSVVAVSPPGHHECAYGVYLDRTDHTLRSPE